MITAGSDMTCSKLLLLFSGSLIGISAFAQAPATPNTPIQHVIIIIQENRTPANLFFADKTLISRGAHLVGFGNCHGTKIALTPWQIDACFDPNHGHNAGWLPSYDNGKMDGACDDPPGLQHGCGIAACTDTAYAHCPQYSYVPNDDGNLTPYFTMAENYGFANYMFQTNQGPSFPAHQFLFLGHLGPGVLSAKLVQVDGGRKCRTSHRRHRQPQWVHRRSQHHCDAGRPFGPDLAVFCPDRPSRRKPGISLL